MGKVINFTKYDNDEPNLDSMSEEERATDHILFTLGTLSVNDAMRALCKVCASFHKHRLSKKHPNIINRSVGQCIDLGVDVYSRTIQESK